MLAKNFYLIDVPLVPCCYNNTVSDLTTQSLILCIKDVRFNPFYHQADLISLHTFQQYFSYLFLLGIFID